MPLLPFTYAPISQRVADRVFGATVLCQVATWDALIVSVVAGELRLELGFSVVYHQRLADGLPGLAIPAGKGLDSWRQTLYANNECAVYLNPSWTPTATQPQDPRNGQVLYYRAFSLQGDAWETRNADGTRTALVGGLAAAPEPVIKQGNAFALQMENPLGLAQLIRYHLNASNQPPFSKFA